MSHPEPQCQSDINHYVSLCSFCRCFTSLHDCHFCTGACTSLHSKLACALSLQDWQMQCLHGERPGYSGDFLYCCGGVVSRSTSAATALGGCAGWGGLCGYLRNGSWSASFLRLVMCSLVSINFLDVYGGVWFI